MLRIPDCRTVCRALLTALLLLPLAAHALPEDRDQPIKVAADSASFDQKSGVAVYRGNVIIQQGTLEIRADQVTINVDKAGAVQRSIATGKPAHYQQKQDEKKGLVTADAKQIEYNAADQKMTLTGDAHLKQDTSSFQGSVITYFMDKQQVDAQADVGSRVQLNFQPPPRSTTTTGKDKSK
jgi:lipopolysaccharide export system protein LptA